MIKYISISIISIFTFIVSYIVLSVPKVTPTVITVEVNAIVPFHDTFQLFYRQEGMISFLENHSVKKQIKGNNKIQKITFSIPTIDKSINLLRLDVGQHKQERPIIIKSIKLKSLQNYAIFNLNKDFRPNDFVKTIGDTVYTQVLNNRYDPYFISTFKVEEVTDNLKRKRSLLDKKTIMLISLIISITFFFVFFYQTIKLNFDWYVIIVFFLILIAPSLSDSLGFKIKKTVPEKRELRTKPKLELTSSYPKEFENYFNDNFGLRNLFINWNSKLKLNYFKVSPKPESVLFGKNGFLFYNSKSDRIYDSYSNKDIIEPPKIKRIVKKHIELRDKLKAKGIKYVLGFFPNKHTIYPENLPFSMKMQIDGDKTLADQIVSYFKKSSLAFVDVRKNLLLAKSKNQLYYKFDTHWNSYGAFIGYKSFCEQTFEMLNLIPYDVNHFNIKYSKKRNGDLTNMIGIKEIESYYDNVPSFILKDNEIGYKIVDSKGYPKRTVVTLNENCANKETALIFRDSYTTALIPFLSLHFRKVIYIWQHSVDINMVEKYNPDIVMSLPVERFLISLL